MDDYIKGDIKEQPIILKYYTSIYTFAITMHPHSFHFHNHNKSDNEVNTDEIDEVLIKIWR